MNYYKFNEKWHNINAQISFGKRDYYAFYEIVVAVKNTKTIGSNNIFHFTFVQ